MFLQEVRQDGRVGVGRVLGQGGIVRPIYFIRIFRQTAGQTFDPGAEQNGYQLFPDFFRHFLPLAEKLEPDLPNISLFHFRKHPYSFCHESSPC